MALWRVGDTIVEKFALFNPATGARLVTGATFTVVANDGIGADISNQITVTQMVNSPGIYTFSLVPAQEGTYCVSVAETTTNQQILAEYTIGSSVTDHIWNLGNQGQTVVVGSGGGGYSYTGTVTVGGVLQSGVLVRVYQAQDPEAFGADASAVTDLTAIVAQATTNGSGQFIVNIPLSYYTLVYFVSSLPYQTYIRWSINNSVWVVSANPIKTSQL